MSHWDGVCGSPLSVCPKGSDLSAGPKQTSTFPVTHISEGLVIHSERVFRINLLNPDTRSCIIPKWIQIIWRRFRIGLTALVDECRLGLIPSTQQELGC